MSKMFKRFTWNPAWVRPYESPYSVLVNFARVNVLSSKTALEILECTLSDLKKLTNMLFTQEKHTYSSSHIFNVLYPESFTNNHFTSCESVVQVKRALHEELHYCPRCLYCSGYHSVIHQMIGIKTCPIHGIPLQISHNSYYRFSGFVESGLKSEDPETVNVHGLPLPPEREPLDFSYILNKSFVASEQTIFDIIGPSNTKKSDMFAPYFLTDICSLPEVRCLPANYRERGLEEEFHEFFLKGFKETYTHFDFLNESNCYFFTSIDDYLNSLLKSMKLCYYHNFSAAYPLAIEQACVMNLIGTCRKLNITGLRNLDRQIDSLGQLDCLNEDILKIVFCYLMVGCQYPKDIISPRYFHYNYRNNLNRPRTNEDLSIAYLWTTGSSPLLTSYMYIQFIIQKDMFFALWKEFYRIVEEERSQDLSHIAARLPLVRYIVTKDLQDKIHIYRQTAMKY